jgi:hypothetical protein
MTNSMSHSDKSAVEYSSSLWCDAASCEGVRYRIARVSLGRRIELARKIREIGRKLEFLEAGSDARERLEAMVLTQEIDRAYLEWGLEAVEGLSINGEAATPESLIETGPADLGAEILARIKSECGLNEDERKN